MCVCVCAFVGSLAAGQHDFVSSYALFELAAQYAHALKNVDLEAEALFVMGIVMEVCRLLGQCADVYLCCPSTVVLSGACDEHGCPSGRSSTVRSGTRISQRAAVRTCVNARRESEAPSVTFARSWIGTHGHTSAHVVLRTHLRLHVPFVSCCFFSAAALIVLLCSRYD